jgi:hypothetical protein
MKRMYCDQCRFFENEVYDDKGNVEHGVGECRRRAPAANGKEPALWPRTFPAEWCGEHEPAGVAT